MVRERGRRRRRKVMRGPYNYDEGAEQEEEGEGEGEGEAAVRPTDTPEGREDKREEELVPAATQDNDNLVLYEIQSTF